MLVFNGVINFSLNILKAKCREKGSQQRCLLNEKVIWKSLTNAILSPLKETFC